MADRSAPPSLALVQDLANTLDIESGQDALAAPGGLAAFLRDHGLPPAPAGKRALSAVQRLREALRAACLAHTGTDLAEETERELEALLTAAPLTLTVDARGEAALCPAPGLTGVAALTARIAAGIATAAADGTWPRLKACEAHDCQWVFYDRSPAGRSRWCTMAVCGSRAKMRTYRARKAEG
ncbi:CGNR zinc finger domain-containing protein [Streptomyces ochraceiscleroticus]|uniref:CGNR zinc finger domain-containing protein n=1 Tax=Streptomyces ochraceiscleroticus TaxID=47761 RepID=A0ABW1MUS9_9ACTN|nr:CGNR zinc finger domain-containing protein [Streptomyces ochraceiscleroticus]